MKKYQKTLIKYLPLISFVSFICYIVCIEVLFARTGGGGGFSGGGGRSGGGFGGGSGGGGGGAEIIYLAMHLIRGLIYLCLHRPLIGIPLTIFVIYVANKMMKLSASGYQSKMISRYGKMQTKLEQVAQFTKIKKRDPAFDELAFVRNIIKGFVKIQNAWGKENLKAVRTLMSDGAYERLSTNLQMNRASLSVNKMENLKVIDAQIAAVKCGKHFDTIHVAITASANDYHINPKTNKKNYQFDEPIFTEFWSYIRRPGAKTLNKKGPVDGFCPNCGNPLALSDKVQCDSCKAVITSGEYDWVLSEITQDSVFGGERDRQITGLGQLMEKDEEFNVQHMEDRATVAFWRYHAAQFFADKKYIVKLATSSFVKKVAFEFQSDNKGRRTFYKDVAVGAVDVLGFELVQGNDGFDKCSVIVTWSGHLETKPLNQELIPDFDKSSLKKSLLIFIRHTGQSSSLKKSLSANHCFGCGAPEMISDSPSCEYCGRALNDGHGDWVLSDVQPYSLSRGTRVTRSTAAPTAAAASSSALAPDDLVTALICLAMADGNIDEKEKNIIRDVAKKSNISRQKLKQLVARARSEEDFTLQVAQGAALHELMGQLVDVCLADGRVCSSERRLLKKMVKQHNITDIDINQMIKQKKRNLFKEKKAQYKQTKRELKSLK
ncbi:MAG: TIM44-like domain-containing protein [Bacteriovoracaceae bacterium]|nr:TIM44-like domain-containing protein [Bacteriovoracaceae bacterium]